MNRSVSLRDVARQANVSVGTVSHYLNNTAPVSSPTQDRIQKAIDELGYRRNEIARSLRRAHTKTLGVIIPNVANPFYTALFDGAEQEAQQHGYTVTLGITHYNNSLLEEYINTLYNRRMDGIIIDGYSTYCADELFRTVDVPIVVIEPPSDLKTWSTIRINNVAASREAVEYLIGRGHKRIGIITPSRGDRFQGYQQALQKHGIALDETLIYEFGPFASDAIAQGEQAAQVLLSRASCTACFATADVLAIGALKAAREMGIRVPSDLAIVGFDNIPFAALTEPPLTTVSQSQHRMGKVAVEILLKYFEAEQQLDPVHIVIDHKLVIRESA